MTKLFYSSRKQTSLIENAEKPTYDYMTEIFKLSFLLGKYLAWSNEVHLTSF